MNMIRTIMLAILGSVLSLAAHADSAFILAKSQTANPVRYQFAQTKGAEIRNTSDNKAYSIWWQPSTTPPTAVIVTLHGHDSYATDEFYLWQPYALQKGYAILALQWWFGVGETTSDYYLPQEMYPLIAALLTEKGVKPGAVLFHGYSRGSANSYAVTALDAYSGNHFFAMTLSNSGGAASDFPPNQQIVAGAYGDKPFAGIQWIMYCGEKDPNPTMSGCVGMTAAKEWVIQYGATIKLFIDDPNGGHEGFMTNASNVNAALEAFAPLAAVTAPYMGLWWNSNESGWGMSITQHGSTIANAMYTYDGTGQPTWYTMACTLAGTSCTGDIYKTSGGTSPTVPWDGAGKVTTPAGSGTLTFTDANTGTFTYTLNNLSGSKSISRMVFATGSAPSVDYTDLWWNPNEDGWGVALTQQYGTISAAWYSYDATGKAVWYVGTCTVSGSSCAGDLLQVTGGSPLTSVWHATNTPTSVGTMSFAFTDANNGTMSYVINGVPDSRTIKRLSF